MKMKNWTPTRCLVLSAATALVAASYPACTETPSQPPQPQSYSTCVLPSDFENSVAVFVDISIGSDNSPGLRNAPKKTIAAGISTAGTAGKGVVCVAEGAYNESVEIVPGISLVGGFSSGGSWERDPTKYATSIQGTLAHGLRVSLFAVNIEIQTCVDGFEILGSDGVTAGENSHAVYVSQSDALTLRNCVVQSGKGKDGANGAAGKAGVPGGGGPGGLAGIAPPIPDTPPGIAFCNSASPGGNGGGCGAQPGGKGGEPGTSCVIGPLPISSCPTGTSGDGKPGSAGQPGQPGAGGSGSQLVPKASPVSLYWKANDGTKGTDGGCGSGGGGGASTCSGRNVTGGGQGTADGGRGGTGGSGSTGGGAGLGGGGSFAIFVVESSCSLINLRLSGGVGGRGGKGGAEAIGGAGESGGTGESKASTTGSAWTAGDGGSGGLGGRGGAGGGGAGGVSYCIYSTGTKQPNVANNLYIVGEGGAGGAAGGSGAGAGSSGAAGDVLHDSR